MLLVAEAGNREPGSVKGLVGRGGALSDLSSYVVETGRPLIQLARVMTRCKRYFPAVRRIRQLLHGVVPHRGPQPLRRRVLVCPLRFESQQARPA